ncbi:MAG TPA: alginate lyase family protein, partial [Longimicrobiales bacterium]|nr:alginate lyase family protein [Longimicrobiales bacterium]
LTGVALMDDALEMDGPFRILLAGALHQHGRHIEANLEYTAGRTGNHYLADIVGLIAIGAALPGVPDADRWLLYGVQELAREMEHQVLPDGADIEGSTAYHAFVGEMFLAGTAIAARLPRSRRQQLASVRSGPVRNPLAPPLRPLEEQNFDLRKAELFPDTHYRRLEQMAELAAELSKPDGCMPQVGDNDSGRVFRLVPPADDLDSRQFPAAVGRMIARRDLERAGPHHGLHAALVWPDRAAAETLRTAAGRARDAGPSVVRRLSGPSDARVAHYPDAGLVIVRRGPLYLLANLGRIPARAPGGHFHNDVLGFELQWHGVDVVLDPGTFVYTPLPELRNAYRRTAAHSTVSVAAREQRLSPPPAAGLFLVVEDVADAGVDALTVDRLAAHCAYGSVIHRREWRWSDDTLEIRDHVEGGAAQACINLAPGIQPGEPAETGGGWEVVVGLGNAAVRMRWEGVARPEVVAGVYSRGYGRKMDNYALRAVLRGADARIELRWEGP